MNIRQKKALQALVELALVPSKEMRAMALAEKLGLTREAVYQLLLPMVRLGVVEAGRGRNGGYRLNRRALGVSTWAVMAPFSSDAALREQGSDVPPYVARLDGMAEEAYRRTFEEVTVEALIRQALEANQVPSYDI
jgi:DNA-binding IscR family transcriptional regulator